jgi:hypothetical protein
MGCGVEKGTVSETSLKWGSTNDAVTEGHLNCFVPYKMEGVRVSKTVEKRDLRILYTIFMVGLETAESAEFLYRF